MDWKKLLLVLVVALAAGIARAADDPLHRTVGGYSVYVGVIPTGIFAYRQDHGDLHMHGGLQVGRNQHHVMASLFDVASGARVADATVTARVTGPRESEEKSLPPITIDGQIAYGNFFRLRQGERYRIELTIRGAAGVAEAAFDYRHDF